MIIEDKKVVYDAFQIIKIRDKLETGAHFDTKLVIAEMVKNYYLAFKSKNNESSVMHYCLESKNLQYDRNDSECLSILFIELSTKYLLIYNLF